MNREKNILNTIKETFLLVCFIVFLFSFSQRTYGRTLDKSSFKSKIELLSKNNLGIVTKTIDPKKVISVLTLNKNTFQNNNHTRFFLESKKNHHFFIQLKNCYNSTKAQINLVFYYHLSSLGKEFPH